MMKRRSMFLMPSLIVAALPLVTSAQQPEAKKSVVSLQLRVSSFRNTKGMLSCRVFTEPNSFPDGDGVKTVRAKISGKDASCTIENVPPGTYAVAVIHDQNANGRLDKNFFGVPTEGYGVSNNRTYALSSPKWDEAKFTVAANEAVAMTVSLRY